MNPLILMLLIFVGLMFLGMPVAFACAIGSLLYLLTSGLELQTLPQFLVIRMTSFTLLAIPFFILMGELMNRFHITDLIISFVKAFVGHITGGLGQVNVVTSMILAGMSGCSISDAAMTSNILIPAMKKEGYDLPFSAAVTAASSTVGPVIPPSVGMVLLASINGLSVGKLFAGGFIPGFLMGITQMLIVYLLAKKRKYPKSSKASYATKIDTLKKTFPALLTPVIVLGGLLSGFFTATEAAVVGVIYILLLGFFYKTLSFKDIIESLLSTMRICSATIFIVSASSVFAWALTMSRIVHILTQYTREVITSPFMFIVIVNLFLILMGCFVSTTALIVIVSPILFPIAMSYGIDPIHFGLIIILNLRLGVLTPPVGIISWVVIGIAQVSYKDYLKELWPFLGTIAFVVLAVSFLPKIVIWLPNLLFP